MQQKEKSRGYNIHFPPSLMEDLQEIARLRYTNVSYEIRQMALQIVEDNKEQLEKSRNDRTTNECNNCKSNG